MDLFATENRVHAAHEVHHNTHLYIGQKVVISSGPLFGENGVIAYLGYNRWLGEVIQIDLVDRLTQGSFSRCEFRIR